MRLPENEGAPRKKTNKVLTNPTFQLLGYRKIIRMWMPRIANGSQSCVVALIFDQTIGSGHWDYFLNYDQIAERCGLSRCTVRRAVKKLCDSKFICRRNGSKGGYAYRLNYQLIFPELESKLPTYILRKPRHLKVSDGSKVEKSGKKGDQIDQAKWISGDQIEHGIGRSSNTIQNKASSPDASRRVGEISSKKITDAGIGRSRTRSDSQYDTVMHKESAHTNAEIKFLWATAYTDAHGDAFGFAQKDAFKLRTVWKRWKGHDHTPREFARFLVWSVQNWRMVTGQYMSTMADVPDLPKIGFFVALVSNFEAGWMARKEMKRLAKLTPREQAIEKMMKKGFDREAAECAYDESHGIAEARDQNQQALAALQRERYRRREERIVEERHKAMDKYKGKKLEDLFPEFSDNDEPVKQCFTKKKKRKKPVGSFPAWKDGDY